MDNYYRARLMVLTAGVAACVGCAGAMQGQSQMPPNGSGPTQMGDHRYASTPTPSATMQVRSLTMTSQVPPSSMPETTFAKYVNMFFPPNFSYAPAAHAAGIYTVGYFDINAASSASFMDRNGRGANLYGASPDVDSTPYPYDNSEFYQEVETGPTSGPNIITTSDGPINVNNNLGGVLQYVGDPRSGILQEAAVNFVKASYTANYDAVESDNNTNLSENFANGSPFGAICNGVGTFVVSGSQATYACTAPASNVTAVLESKDVQGYSDATWLTASEQLENKIPKPVIVNSIQVYLAGETTSASAQLTVAASNVVGAYCEACFENNVFELQETLANFQSVIKAGKKVIASSENVETIARRESDLAALALVYDPKLVYESTSPSCATGASGLDLCPEVALVFNGSQDFQTASSGLLTRLGKCSVNGTSLGTCIAEVNANTGDDEPTIIPTGATKVELLTPNSAPSADYVSCSAANNCFAPLNSKSLIPATLTPGQGTIGILESS